MKEFIAQAILAMIIGYTVGSGLAALVDRQEKNPSWWYLAFLYVWEGMKRPLRRLFEGKQ